MDNIHVARGEKASVVVHYRSAAESGEREIVVGEGGFLELVEIVEGPVTVRNHIVQAAGSRVHAVVICLGGGAARVWSVTDLTGPRAESDHYALWLAAGDARTDLDIRVNHLAPDCRSFQLVKGVASGAAAGTFNGLVYVARDAQRTVALQQSRNLLMSETARIHAEPQLEIYADDVKCSHGATVGQMDADAILYMRQRGLSDADARRLQMSGFVNDIVSRIPDEPTRDLATDLIKEKI